MLKDHFTLGNVMRFAGIALLCSFLAYVLSSHASERTPLGSYPQQTKLSLIVPGWLTNGEVSADYSHELGSRDKFMKLHCSLVEMQSSVDLLEVDDGMSWDMLERAQTIAAKTIHADASYTRMLSATRTDTILYYSMQRKDAFATTSLVKADCFRFPDEFGGKFPKE